MGTSRIDAFSDGVFAIAFTVLVLDLTVPDLAQTDLLYYLASQGPSFLAYGISVLLIGLVWANHRSMFAHIRKTDRTLLLLNTLLLADVAFIPFPTSMLAHAFDNPVNLKIAAVFYGLTLVIGGIFHNAILLYAMHKQFVTTKSSLERAVVIRNRFLVGPVSYLAATLSALISPYIAIACYVGLIIFYWLPPKGEVEA